MHQCTGELEVFGKYVILEELVERVVVTMIEDMGDQHGLQDGLLGNLVL